MLPASPTVEDILEEYVASRDEQPDPFVRTEFVQGKAGFTIELYCLDIVCAPLYHHLAISRNARVLQPDAGRSVVIQI